VDFRQGCCVVAVLPETEWIVEGVTPHLATGLFSQRPGVAGRSLRTIQCSMSVSVSVPIEFTRPEFGHAEHPGEMSGVDGSVTQPVLRQTN
jgi:hypothetical protein